MVPPRIKVVAFNLLGAAGGGLSVNTHGVRADTNQGLGGRISGLVLTDPGQTLGVTLGGRGGSGDGVFAPFTRAAGFNGGGAGGSGVCASCGGGGGGGMSMLSGPSGVFAVAGGGGGGSLGHFGGGGGGLVGLPGSRGTVCGTAPDGSVHEVDGASGGGSGGGPAVGPTAGGGAGGTSTGGGAPGQAGSAMQGGAGASSPVLGGSGGGGGWFGGGGGAGGFDGNGSIGTNCGGGGGGGGSSWFQWPAADVIAEPGVWPLDGHAVFSWLDDGGPVPVAVQVTPTQVRNPGQTATVTAKVLDQDGNGMPGRLVTFDRKGTYPGTTTATTDPQGNATTQYAVYGPTGGGADVVIASTPSLANVPVSGVGTVIWNGPPRGTPATVLTFTPPGAHAPSGTATLDFVARYGDGSPVRNRINYAVYPLGSTPGAFSWQTTTADELGRGRVTVTAPQSEVEVYAYADKSALGMPETWGFQEADEVGSRAVVTTRAAPRGTAVTFTPPAGTAPVGSSVPLAFKATYSDGAPFTGSARWCAAPAASTSTSCISSGTVTANSSGAGVVTVTPTAATPTLRVTAYADALTPGTQDSTEAIGAATAAGITPPSLSDTTALAFVAPVAHATHGNSVTLAFTAKRGDGSPFVGTVRYGTGPPGPLSYDRTTITNTAGNGWITVTPTASTPLVQVTAFADRAGGGFGNQEPTEVSAVALGIGVPPPPPPPRVTTVAFTPPVATTTPGSTKQLEFTALESDGTPFTGTVIYSARAPGAPVYSNSTSTGADGKGAIFVTPTPDTPVIQVLAFADNGSGVQDPVETSGAAAVSAPPVPDATAVAFLSPVGQGPTGSVVRMPFSAVRGDGTPFTGSVRYAVGPAGSVPVFSGSVLTDVTGAGEIAVTPAVDDRAVQVLAYADGGTVGTREATEALGAAAVVNSEPPPPPTPGTELVFPTAVGTGPPGVTTFAAFTARNHDGSPFVGTVRWGSGPAGSSPALTQTVELDESHNGAGFVAVPAGPEPVQIVAYADRAAGGRPGRGDETEVPGTAFVLGAG